MEEEIIELCQELLQLIGIKLSTDDESLISFCVKFAAQTVKNKCNVSEVPEGLKYATAYMACGEFLQMKHQTGTLDADSIDFDAAASALTIGDVRIDYPDGSNASSKVDTLISFLLTSKGSELACFRKLRW